MQIFEGSLVYDEEKNEYHVGDFIANGGFGSVFCIDRNGKKYALKVLTANIPDEKEYKSFINEAKTAIGIEHPNVIKYLYFHDGTTFTNLPPYIIMEFAQDGTLRKFLDTQEKLLSNDELLRIAIQLLSGMSIISQKFVHRDLKPENILISSNMLKITDFGLSKLVNATTRNTTFKGWGSSPYIAPEAWKLKQNTIQMDIYSLGIIFYELATLRHPLEIKTGSVDDWHNAHLFQVPPLINTINPNISPILEQVIMKMMEKDTASRYSNWNDILNKITTNSTLQEDNKEIISVIISRRNKQKAEQTKKRVERERKEKEKNDLRALVLHQLQNDIVAPIKQFIKELNELSSDEKIYINSDTDSFLNMISLNSKKIMIDFEPIYEENFYRERIISDFSQKISKMELQLPQIDGKRILAWGFIKGNDNRGFNIILLENEESVFGSWKLLFNTNSIFTHHDQKRPEPFAFTLDEIEEEIKLINATHIYVTTQMKLDINEIKKFIGDYF